MPDTTPITTQETFWRMRVLADQLSAAGLDTRLHDTRGSLDVTAVTRPAGNREIEAVIDEDNYVELRYWQPGATPAQICDVILRALAVIRTG